MSKMNVTTPSGLFIKKGNFVSTNDDFRRVKRRKPNFTPDDMFDFSKLDIEGYVKALYWARKQRILRNKICDIIKMAVKNNLHKAVSVSSYSESVKYGQVIQLHIIDCLHEEYGDSDTMPEGRVLCGNIPSIKESVYLKEGCNLRAGSYLEPCVRNTFQFLDPSGITFFGLPVLFNRDIVIKLYDSEESHPLYIEGYCVNDAEGIPNHYNLRFTNSINPSCYFRIRHPIQGRRHQYDGTRIPPDVRLVFEHTTTGLYLATEFGILEENIFGMEPIIDLRTCIDHDFVHKKENMFIVYVG